ncbi:MAG: phytanoyl-CoA dioxygenase family protein [Gammaproteobacteria bacterium]|nr:phytanoyl-CoA dioxygenase family protein [Gammaproteobacteria bacterium]
MVNSACEWQTDTGLSAADIEHFQRDGFLILRGFAAPATVETLRGIAEEHLRREIAPLEYEADLHYPGAPSSRSAEGGRTVRRLLQAQGRHPAFTQWLDQPALLTRLHQLLGPEVLMPLAHHNCIMTKQPRFSSDTGWHQDIRYWAFERAELINVWLALGPEREDNGCLRLIPGSHRCQYEKTQFDNAQFFREDVAANRPLLEQALNAELEAGDILLFHCRTLHAATRNFSEQTKYSAVFTFRAGDNRPLPGTRSAALPELHMP